MLTYIYTDSCDLLQVGSAFDFKSVLTEKDCNENDFDGDFKGSFRGKSAYEVTQKKKGKEKKNAKTASERDPIRLLQDMGKKFGVKGLAKRSDLYDITIQAEDGMEVCCHKCVLVARLEYFHSMLSSGWVETSSNQALTLPVPGDCLQILVDFLYSDEAPGVTGSRNIELICNVLVMADQLLVSRLVEICEVTLSQLGSLYESTSHYPIFRWSLEVFLRGTDRGHITDKRQSDWRICDAKVQNQTSSQPEECVGR
uniref:Inhibitor of Bruton tyrosine kinase n=1 Tax=Magallana gigas TaxID=29159 RepID=K1QTZ4_MAGGI